MILVVFQRGIFSLGRLFELDKWKIFSLEKWLIEVIIVHSLVVKIK
jgi:hypothetical protein